jgi:SAM-dependent methyltransferase
MHTTLKAAKRARHAQKGPILRMAEMIGQSLLHFEEVVERAVAEFTESTAADSRVLGVSSGEIGHTKHFKRHRYCSLELSTAHNGRSRRRPHVIGDPATLPFPKERFDACVNLLTLEHVPEPGLVLRELAKTLKPGGELLLVVQQESEISQEPHDYYRFTRFGVQYLLENAGFTEIIIKPVGGLFQLLSRRLFDGLEFIPVILFPLAALLLAPLALALPLLDFLDRDNRFTLGYVCTARRPLMT